MAFDAVHAAAICRPGERLVAGRPYIFSQDLLNAHLADEWVAEGLPADLSGLSDGNLAGAFYAYLSAHSRRRNAEVEAFGAAVCNERALRAAQAQKAA